MGVFSATVSALVLAALAAASAEELDSVVLASDFSGGE